MPFAEDMDGPNVAAVASMAKSYGIAVVFPYFEKGENGVVYDSVDLFDRFGTRQLHYRKVRVVAHKQQRTRNHSHSTHPQPQPHHPPATTATPPTRNHSHTTHPQLR
jgi:hypothetical protein